MILPLRRASIAGRKSRVRSVSAAMLRWIWPKISSSEVEANSPKTPKPALLTRISTATPSRPQLVEEQLRSLPRGEIERHDLHRDSNWPCSSAAT